MTSTNISYKNIVPNFIKKLTFLSTGVSFETRGNETIFIFNVRLMPQNCDFQYNGLKFDSFFFNMCFDLVLASVTDTSIYMSNKF